MAKKSKAEILAFYSTDDGIRKINTVRNGILNNTITNFPEVFATIAASNIQAILGKEYYAFSKTITDPGRFTLNEIEALAELLNLNYDQMHLFIRKAMIAEQKKAKRRKSK